MSFSPTLLRSFIILLLFTAGCSKTSNTEEKQSENKDRQPDSAWIVPAENRDWDTVAYEKLVAQLPAFDLKQDLSGKSAQELRILRNTLPARKGYLFMNADLRHYFYNTSWYRKLMEARWYGNCEFSGVKPAPPITYTAEETAFIERAKKAEEQQLSQNYIVRNGLKYANVKNIVNAWQFGNIPAPLLAGLDRNGFAIVPNNNVQLFHLYEQNDYSQTQNFVSTDLYLQLFHMHFSLMLRGLEEKKFVPILRALASGMLEESKRLAGIEKDTDIKSDLQYTQAFYAVPLNLLGEKNTSFASTYHEFVASELGKIKTGVTATSDLLPAYNRVEFSYDLFKPRGHYTRTDELKQYFQAMQWLQQGVFCLEDDIDLRWALTAAFILNTGKAASGEPLKKLYTAILEPTSFLIGKPDNLSLLDICYELRTRNINSLKELLKPEMVSALRVEFEKLQQTKNVIKPKIENACPGKINFMPARFVLDNEILQEMTDLDARPYPKGLDVMAAFGSEAAENILVSELEEIGKWDQFLPQLEKMKSKYKNYEDWDASVYSKWIQGLNTLLLPDKKYPSFMQLPSWNKKNLNTALASWAELKHDAILYAEQPMAAECGGGGDCEPPPEPYVIGYVEPNVNYWKSAQELLSLTTALLNEHGLLDDEISNKQSQLSELCAFLLKVSEKELRGEELVEQEYRTIELIGTSVENITLRIFGTDTWSYVSGPDKEVAVVADIYTNNQGNKAGILHSAVGYANDLYVVVEIGGYLYLTKGATFSYYEFSVPLNQRMTDEEWQDMLKKGKVFPLEPWLQDIIIKLDKPVETQIQYNYSSGC
jgi:hypothetical protein